VRRAITLIFLCLAASAPLWAGFTVQLKTTSGQTPVEAELNQGRVMVDLLQAAAGLGAKVSIKDGEYVLAFASATAIVNPDSALYRVRPAGAKKWWGAGFDVRPYYSDAHLMVDMQDLPTLTFKTFTYHLQRKELTDNDLLDREGGLSPDKRAVPARRLTANHKEWISMEDAARALGVVVYTSRAQGYSLVLPDFSILDVTVGGQWVDRKKVHYKPLEDPILLFSGAPYGTAHSLSTLFGVDLSWDAANGMLVIPARYGRLADAKPVERAPLTITGYRPSPLQLTLDEAALFYQNPGPTYSADHPNVYESVRNLITNEPIKPPTQGYDRMSGEAVLSLGGSVLDTPMTGGARLEKVGTRGRLASGSLEWGFPGPKPQPPENT
jgi:hypothetical protein